MNENRVKELEAELRYIQERMGKNECAQKDPISRQEYVEVAEEMAKHISSQNPEAQVKMVLIIRDIISNGLHLKLEQIEKRLNVDIDKSKAEMSSISESLAVLNSNEVRVC